MAAVRPLVVKAGRVRMLPASDSLDWSWLSGVPAPLALWAGIAPTTKADTIHSHVVSDVAGLQSALNGKAAVAHAHAITDVSGLQSDLSARPPLVMDGDWLSTSGGYIAVSTIYDAANSSLRWTAPADYTNIVSFPSKDGYTGLALAAYFGSGNRFWIRSRHDQGGAAAWQRWKPWAEIALHGTDVSYLTVNTTGPNALRIGASDNSDHGYITFYTAGNTTTRTAYIGFGDSSTTTFGIVNERGGRINLEGEFVHVLDRFGGGMQLRPSGEIWLGDANNRAYHRRQPRIFIQSGDPGAAATAGDLWGW